MITEAATSSPSSVRRRALKARRRTLGLGGSSRSVADIDGEPTGGHRPDGGAGADRPGIR